MTGQIHLTLRNPQELAALPQRLTLRQGQVRLTLALPGLGEPDRSLAEVRLSALLTACGCSEGALALIAALPPAVWLAFLSHGSPAGWQGWALFFGVLVVASVLGKILGLMIARRRLTAEIACLLARL